MDSDGSLRVIWNPAERNKTLHPPLLQLERAQGGGVDTEARRKLQALEEQLGRLQAAQQQAAQQEQAASAAPLAVPAEEMIDR